MEAVKTLEPQYQGAAREGQRVLIKRWFDGISQSRERGEKVAYAFVIPSAFELLRSFDIQVIALPEVQALQCAVKKVGQQYLTKAEEMGYSLDVCGYVKIDAAMLEMGGGHPLGKIPPPDLVICPTLCNTYIKWAEIWEDRFNAPLMLLDQPSRIMNVENYWGSADYEIDLKYMMSQMEDLIEACERITGKRFDPDKLAYYEGQWNQVADLWMEIREFNKRIPAVFDSFEDGLYYMGGIQACRGSGEAIPFMNAIKQELEERVALGIYPVKEERFRMFIDLAPCWSKLRSFIGLFKKWDVLFVYGTYMSMLVEPEFRYDTSRPLESLAESLIYFTTPGSTMNLFSNRLGQTIDLCQEYSIDGVVLHAIKSCRAISGGIVDEREFLQRAGIPTLFLDSDLVDARYFSEAQMRNRVDAFFESLERKKFYR
ncbi:MAG: 2-hydroxyacyl-CoA dehydratase, partial [Nitrospinae bacterium]|nr:2-hydroxyacyl-CoA dehydratase [Nitrospinota bacterium]